MYYRDFMRHASCKESEELFVESLGNGKRMSMWNRYHCGLSLWLDMESYIQLIFNQRMG